MAVILTYITLLSSLLLGHVGIKAIYRHDSCVCVLPFLSFLGSGSGYGWLLFALSLSLYRMSGRQ